MGWEVEEVVGVEEEGFGELGGVGSGLGREEGDGVG